MAELLIKAASPEGRTSPAEAAKLHHRGDVIAVQEDGFPWGRREGPPDFVVVSIPKHPARDFLHLVESEVAESAVHARDGASDGETIRARRWRLDIDSRSLPTTSRADLAARGRADLTREQVALVTEDKTGG